MGDVRGAILSHWKAFTIDGQSEKVEKLLVEEYHEYAPRSCATTGSQLNLECSFAKRQLCDARHQLVEQVAAAGYPEESEIPRARSDALSLSGCPAS